MTITQKRFELQVKDSVGRWELFSRGTKSDWPEGLNDRAKRMVAKGHPEADVRVWDGLNRVVYIAPAPHVFTPEELAEKAKRAEEHKAREAAYWEKYNAELDAQMVIYNAEQAAAEAKVAQATVDSVEAFEALSHAEQGILIGGVVGAYLDTNIDGYGDEGAGYDGFEFAQNLLKLGWVFQPKK